jgi:hypothetical protein
MNTYQRETTEFQEVLVGVNGSQTTSFEVALTAQGTRPTVWSQPTILEGKAGALLTGLTPGEYSIWVRVTDLPEVPVLHAGRISII